MDSHLGVVMVSVLAIGPSVRGIKPGRGDWFLMAIKIRSTPSFGGKVKLKAPCRKILWHIENQLQIRKKNFVNRIYHSLRPLPLLATRWLPESSGGWIRSFLCRRHSTMVVHAHTSPDEWTIGPLVAAFQRRSLTPSTWSSLLSSDLSCRMYFRVK
jgi:hypothetical protein